MTSTTARRKQAGAVATKAPPRSPEPCDYCSKADATLACKGCGEGHYCDKQCFTKHWPHHRETCTWRKDRETRLQVNGKGKLRGRSRQAYLVPGLVALIAIGWWWFSSATPRGAAWEAAAVAALPAWAKRALHTWRSSSNDVILFMRYKPVHFFFSCLPLVLLLGRIVIAYRMYTGKTRLWAADGEEGAAADASKKKE